MRTRALLILAAFLLGLFMVACNDAKIPTNHSNNIIPYNTKIISLSDEMKLEDNIKAGFNPNPLLVDTLSNNTIVIVNQASTMGDIVTAYFTYIPENESPRERIIKLHKSLYSLALYDNSGILLCGYDATQSDSNNVNLSVFSENFKLGISTPIEGNGNLKFEVICDGVHAYTEFANEAVFDSAISIYENVYDNGYNRELLSPEQLELLTKLENFNVCSGIFDEIDESEVDISKVLAGSKQFKEAIGISDSGNSVISEMPKWLKKICTIVNYAKKICSIIGNTVICEYVEILSIICDMLAEIFE